MAWIVSIVYLWLALGISSGAGAGLRPVVQVPVEDASGAAAVEIVRGSDLGGGIGGILHTEGPGEAVFNHYNSRGDVVGQTDGGGSVTWEAAYEGFGKRTDENGTATGRQRANTKDEDATGLLNEGHRYRCLETGVFLTRDPAGFVDGPNVDSYVRQNPWTMFDPLGLWGLGQSNGFILDGLWDRVPSPMGSVAAAYSVHTIHQTKVFFNTTDKVVDGFNARDAVADGRIPFCQYDSPAKSPERAGEIAKDVLTFGLVGRGGRLPTITPRGPYIPVPAGGPTSVAANPSVTFPVPVLVSPNFSTNSPGGNTARDSSEASSGGAKTAEQRAAEIHGTLKPGTQSRTTTSVIETAEGTRVVSSSERRLRPAQRKALQRGEVEGVGSGHAEVTGVNAAERMGLTPTGAAASRPICPSCADTLQQRGVQPLIPLKKR